MTTATTEAARIYALRSRAQEAALAQERRIEAARQERLVRDSRPPCTCGVDDAWKRANVLQAKARGEIEAVQDA